MIVPVFKHQKEWLDSQQSQSVIDLNIVPNRPQVSFNRRKPIKYEVPPKQQTGVFASKVPLKIWEAIATRYEIPPLIPHLKAFTQQPKENRLNGGTK